jgi:hypothetical protein
VAIEASHCSFSSLLKNGVAPPFTAADAELKLGATSTAPLRGAAPVGGERF